MVRAGEEFAGYLIERQLGGGGMGEVFLARHPRLPRLVALKLLARELASQAETRARFEREAELIARLDHPNIVTVHDRGVEDGRLWIAMQYVDGGDASTLDPYTLPPREAVHIIAETAKALDYAHSMGVVHRDVKPANILLTQPPMWQERRILLTDFGIGRLRDDSAQITRTGTLAATITYASPEQLSGSALDQRSDQYSLACTLFRLLTGSTPFQAETVAAVVTGHLQHPVPRLSDRRPELPAALDAVVARALAKRPDARFESCRAFAEAAAQALSEVAESTLPPSSSAGAANATRLLHPAENAAGATAVVTTLPEALTEADTSLLGSNATGLDAAAAGPNGAGQRSNAAGPGSNAAGPGSNAAGPGSNAAGQGPSTARHRLDTSARTGPRRGRWIAAGAGTLAVVLAVAAGIIWTTRHSGSDPTPPPPVAETGAQAAILSGFAPFLQIDAQGRRVAAPISVEDPANDGRLPCSAVSIAAAVPLSGDRDTVALGKNVLAAVNLALSQFLRGGNRACPVKVLPFDTGGDQATAAQAAKQIAADKSIVAVIGPALSPEVIGAGNTLDEAGLPFLTPLASNPVLTQQGWSGFFRGLANDKVQGPALGRYLATTAGFSRVCVVRDNGDGYEAELTPAIIAGLGRAALPECQVSFDRGGDPGTAVQTVAAANPDAVFFAGYSQDAANLLKKLRSAGVAATFVLGDGAYDQAFRTAAGAAATGTIVDCSCGPATDAFLADYKSGSGQDASTYAVEAYDLTAIVLRGIVSGHTQRTDLRDYLHKYHADGIAHSYGWTAAGEPADPRLWLYRLS
ncbi:bifunctional serine/threonine-protein kinase/ABC transporter substrate-binding protein [Nocardia concava]|uniref:bifunctional serine/threonine-protein kinase/ABC transporter substrate-binding protein n=1 Tax=Nocardia concava TaxID=257281 RepID=UPI0002DB0D5A|nr:bifunctional serine/threonine-protein kinase/ABC transporter substrate-binding protein [Nocardia concava]